MPSQPSQETGGEALGLDVLAAALEAVEQPVFVLDSSGVIRFANRAAVADLGYADAGELLGRSSHETIHHHHPDGRPFPASECPILRPRTTGETVESDLDCFFRRDGSMFRVAYVSAPLELTDGLGAVVSFADIDERWRAERAVRDSAARLAEEQAALRRVATLVARGVEPAEIFAAVSREVGRMFGSDLAVVGRWDPDGPSQVIVGLIRPMAGWDVGSRMPLAETTVAADVYRTGRSARTDAPAQNNVAVRELKAVSGVGSPVVVDGRPWGAITVASRESLPPDAEQRLEKFTELVATAVANAESRQALRRLADEQAALRRVATLVAEGAPPSTVFDAVAAEMLGLLQTDGLSVCRYEEDGELTIVAHRGRQAQELPPGRRIQHDDPETISATVRRTGRPARIDRYARTQGRLGELIDHLQYKSGVGVPIVVDGRVWGVTVANWASESPPSDTEQRMAQFGGLLDTAIANADSRDQLTASRARLLTEADDARRRVVRDLHDSAQQRLVHAIVTLKLARAALRRDDADAGSLVDEALDHAQRGNAELRELAHGIHPRALTMGGLRGGVGAVVERLDLPVDVDVIGERLPPEIEASAYFVVAEALTNVVKHSRADRAEVTASVLDGILDVRVRDNGIGGADPNGHGLLGMRDRVTALGGRLEVVSAAGRGTCVGATLPLLPTP